jgi:Zn-dependent M28 family amino/carboxypeptidase
MKDTDVAGVKELKEQKKLMGSIRLEGPNAIPVPAKNVVGKIEGTDPVLKNEYYVISAHYDHVGVGAKKEQDSIYNGARDNALGTVGMMTAARFFAQFPPKRSVIFLALTGEEKGLLGSAWYADHPLVPLNQTVFDFDCDGAGYNDKTVATVIGLERTSAAANISKACEAFGLKAGTDPVPEQNLYERSDNYNFAKKGIPAIDFSTGVKAFDAELMKYYHQPADEVGSLDFEYLLKYYKAFVYANYLIINDPKAPTWTVGDKYEAVGKVLYGR